MKILHIIQRYPPAIGGSETWCQTICRYLAKQGYNVTVLTLDVYNEDEFWNDPPVENCVLRFGRIEYDRGVKVIRCRRTKIHPLFFYIFKTIDRLLKIYLYGPHSIEMYFQMIKEIKECDIVHLHTIPYPHNLIGLFIAKLFRKKIAITPHFHIGHPQYETKVNFWLMKKCAAVFAVSDHEREYFISKGLNKEKGFVAYNSIDPDDYKPKDLKNFKRGIFNKYNITEAHKIVIFIGRKIEYKGIETLIEAAKILRKEMPIKLLLIGPNFPWFETCYSKLSKEEKCDIIDLKVVSHQIKVNLLHLSNLLVLPSKFEAFGIVFLEAWVCGIPVIGIKNEIISEVIADSGLLVDYGDITAMKERIKMILTNAELAKRLVRSGKERIHKEYTLEKIGKGFLLNNNNLLNERKKILIVSHLFPPFCIGGAEIVAYEQALKLNRMGFEIKIFAGKINNSRKQYSMNEERNAFKIFRLNLHNSDFNGRQLVLNKEELLLHFREVLFEFSPQIVHFHNISAFSLKIIDECVKMRIPTVKTLHDYYGICFKNTLLNENGVICSKKDGSCVSCTEQIYTDKGKNIDITQRNSLVMQYYNKIDLFISPSKYLATKYAEFGIPENKIAVINNGIDLSKFRNIKKKNSRKIRLGFIGRISLHKGLAFLLRSISYLSDEEKKKISLLVFGEGERDFSEYCFSLAKQLRIAHIVKFCGYVNNSQIRRVFEKIDMLVVPSLWPENSPLSIMEAFAAGIPVLASNIGGIPELIEDGISGYLFKPNSYISLANSVKNIIAHPEAARIMKAACLRKAKENDLMQQIGIIDDIYKRLINQTAIPETRHDVGGIKTEDFRTKINLHAHILRNENLEEFLGKGWHPVETQGYRKWVWSCSQESFIKLPSRHRHKGWTLGLSSSINGDSISIYDSNESLIGNYSLSSAVSMVGIPADIPFIKIVSQLWSPKTIFGGSDERLLGVCLHGINPLKSYQETCDWPPSIFEIETTTLCNIDPPCVMCSPRILENMPRQSSPSQIIIDKIRPYLRCAETVSLHGTGEPLLCRMLFDFFNMVDINKTYIKFNSNGLLLTREIAEKLILQGLKEINFSIDAANPETYKKIRRYNRFNEVKDNIRLLSELKKSALYPRIITNMTLMKENMRELLDFISLASEVGAEGVYVGLLNKIGQNYIVQNEGFCFNYWEQMVDTNSEEFESIILSAKRKTEALGISLLIDQQDILRVLKQDNALSLPHQALPPICIKPWENALIRINGEVIFCCHMNNNGVLGNLSYQNFEDIWNGPIAKRIRKHFLNNSFPDECLNCPIYNVISLR